jgi:hypothetical protein
MNTTPVASFTHTLTAMRDDLREHREALAAQKVLRRELEAYSTPRDVDDLLGVIADQDGPEAQQIRDLLLRNLRHSA